MWAFHIYLFYRDEKFGSRTKQFTLTAKSYEEIGKTLSEMGLDNWQICEVTIKRGEKIY